MPRTNSFFAAVFSMLSTTAVIAAAFVLGDPSILA